MQFKAKQPEHWHQVLGLRNDATREEVKAAYKKLALAWHPDRHIEDKNMATARFVEINNAYRIIMREHHFEVAKVSIRDHSPPRPALSRPATDSKISTRSSTTRPTFRSRKSSTTLGSSASSSRQSSFESINTPPSTPRLGMRFISTSCDTLSRPAQSSLHHVPPQSISNVLASHSRCSSDLKAPTCLGRQADSAASTSELPEKKPEPLDTSFFAQRPEQIKTSKPPPPSQDTTATLPFPYQPPFVSLGGHSREWKYSLTLTLEELFFGKLCPILITRYLLNGEKLNVVLDVDVPPGCQPGTQIKFRGVGHERRPGLFQDILFVIQQADHDRFHRADNDLVMDVRVPWTENLHRQDGRLCFAGIDGKLLSVKVIRPKAKISTGCQIIREAGMPIMFRDKVIGRGNLVVHWEIIAPRPPRWDTFRRFTRRTCFHG